MNNVSNSPPLSPTIQEKNTSKKDQELNILPEHMQLLHFHEADFDSLENKSVDSINITLKQKYPSNILTHEDKHKYEAVEAIRTLNSNRTTTLINQIVQEVLKVLSNNDLKRAALDFVEDYSNAILTNEHPTESKAINILSSETEEDAYLTLQDLLTDYITNTDRTKTIRALSVLWLLPKYLCRDLNPDDYEEITVCYLYKIIPAGRNHTECKEYLKEDKSKIEFINKDEVGEAKVESDLINILNPVYKLSSYYKENEEASESQFLYLRNKTEHYPYLSGTSGMCNLFYCIYRVLGIELKSIRGLELAHVMSSFVVAIGFHTYQECYDAFFNTDEYMKERDAEEGIIA